MNTPKNRKRIWTKEMCIEEALKYSTRSTFKEGCIGAYVSARKHGWLNEICHHMKVLKTHYSAIECAVEAKKYTTKTGSSDISSDTAIM